MDFVNPDYHVKMVCAQVLGLFFPGRDARARFDVKTVGAEIAGFFFHGGRMRYLANPRKEPFTHHIAEKEQYARFLAQVVTVGGR